MNARVDGVSRVSCRYHSALICKEHYVYASYTLVVGELDLKPIRHVTGIGGDTHVDRAKHWVKVMNQYAQRFGENGQVELKLISDVGHNYGKLARECQEFLIKQI